MDSQTLHATLADMGMDRLSQRAVAALPLVQIAWSDGSVQEAERDLILRVADEQLFLGEEGAVLLSDWLRHRPSDAYFTRGRTVLHALVALGTGGIEPGVLKHLEELAEKVARAAGGWFGFGRVSGVERLTVQEVVASLRAPRPPAAPAATMATSASMRDRMTVMVEDDDEDEDDLVGVLVVEDAHSRRKVRVPPEGVVVGSGERAGVRVQAKGVEGAHVRVMSRRRRFYAEDLGTRGGTTVNGERVGLRRLLGGERLGVGTAQLVFKMAHRSSEPTHGDDDEGKTQLR